MKLHKFKDFDPTTAKYSIKFLLASPTEQYDSSTLIVFSPIHHQHIAVRNQLATILNTDTAIILTAGVFTRSAENQPYKTSLGSESLDKNHISYKSTVPREIMEEMAKLINNVTKK